MRFPVLKETSPWNDVDTDVEVLASGGSTPLVGPHNQTQKQTEVRTSNYIFTYGQPNEKVTEIREIWHFYTTIMPMFI